MRQFYDNFLEALEERYPHKSDLVYALMDVLHLEKESIYRRLRRDVYFSAEEVMRIASEWSISLDNIVCSNPDKTRPFRFKIIEFVNPQKEDYAILEQHNRDLELVANDPNGILIEVVNALPRSLYGRSEHLTRFFTMKWLYKFGMPGNALPFSAIHIPERMRALDMEYVQCIHNIREIHSIHDNCLIEHLIDDIIYFHTIGMLTKDDIALLRDELLILVDYMENVTIKGYLPNTKSKLFFYLSHIWLETEYILFKSKDFNLSVIKILERNTVASLDKKVIDRFMNMVQSTKRTSVLMSESNALQQAEFFTRQKEMVMRLGENKSLKK